MNDSSEINSLIKELYTKSYIGKSNHYFAANRNRLYHTLTGFPAIIINVILGSILFADLRKVVPDLVKWCGALLSFLAAFLGGFQTFFNYKHNFQGHRKIARQLLGIQDQCNYLHKKYADNVITLPNAYKELKELNDKYLKVITDAEAFPTRPQDYQNSLKNVEQKRKKNPNGLLD